MNFRADINGLRALAVLAVLGFHFGVPGLQGGFVGVDVFFVISGYLMTGIILRRLDRGTFSVLAFYLDRGRRIVPPLAVLVTVLLAGGTVCLLPQELLLLGKQAASTVTFLSNFYFWSNSGYFAPQARSQWLLHTWSLAVEWQFYILYPLVMLALRRLNSRSRTLAYVLAALSLASFALCVLLTAKRPTSAFFLLPPRAWEMMTGGLVFLAPPALPWAARPMQLAGLAMILISILFSNSAAWPGAWALGPVLGTALVIGARRTESRITGNPPATWLGLNSYSIYLWHWPVAVILAQRQLTGDWRAIAVGFAIALALGHLSWRFVERGGRDHISHPGIHTTPEPPAWRAHVALVSICALLAVIGAGVWKVRGLPQRFSPQVRALETDAKPGGPYSAGCFATNRDKPPCIVGPRHDRAMATLIGDSHAEAVASAVVAALPHDAPGGLAFSGQPACTPLLGAISIDPENRCDALVRHDLALLTRPRTTPAILVAHWSGAIEGRTIVFGSRSRPWSLAEFRAHLLQTSCALAKAGPTWLMLPTPDFPTDVTPALQRRLIADPHAAEITIPLSVHRRRTQIAVGLLQEAAKTCGVRLLDPVPYLCPDGRTCIGSLHHRAIFRDTHHLTEYGNKLMIPMFVPIFSSR